MKLSDEQIAAQSKLPKLQCLKVTNSHKIIYPGKNHDAWWDLKQLMDQMQHAINIFEYLHPDKVGIWLFNCSSAHEGIAEDALNINNMNINPGGKQWHLHPTVIPINNPPPKPGHPDTRGQPQEMVYPADHPDLELHGQPKGIKAVLQEWESVWDELVSWCKKVVGKCKECLKSQAKKDVERHVAEAETMGQEDTLWDEDVLQAHESKYEPTSDWCCMYWVLLLQEDFVTEKLMLQHYIESHGHICMFLLKFHCKLNPIRMLWGFAKYCESSIFSFDSLLSKVITTYPMVNLQLQKELHLNVSTCVTCS